MKRRIADLKVRRAPLRRPILLLSIIVSIVGFVVLIKSSNGDKYCGGVAGCVTETRIYNDTNSTFTVKQCESLKSMPCDSFADIATLKPGDVHRTNGTTDGTPQPWVVFDQDNKVIGCLNLTSTSYQQPPIIARLSGMPTCSQVNDAIAAFKRENFTF